MNKHESVFVDNLIRTMDAKRKTHCPYCYELLFELKLLQAGKVTERQVRITNI